MNLSEEKPRLYLETTIPSYLAARPSRDLIVAGHQQVTREWWDHARHSFDVYVSPVVLNELESGDPDAAARRLEYVADLPVVPLTDEVLLVRATYRERLGLPGDAEADLLHLAISVVHEMVYLLTWNCRHLANGVVIRRLQEANVALGRPTPIILTPEELIEEPD